MGQEGRRDANPGVGDEQIHRAVDAAQANRDRPPLGVNLIAFDNRFQITCCRRTGSPLTTPSDGSASVSTRMNLASAAGRSVSTPLRTNTSRSTSCTSRRSVPPIAWDTSSRSLMSRVCARALRSIVSIAVFRRAHRGRRRRASAPTPGSRSAAYAARATGSSGIRP
jgi:hypothetical protein